MRGGGGAYGGGDAMVCVGWYGVWEVVWYDVGDGGWVRGVVWYVGGSMGWYGVCVDDMVWCRVIRNRGQHQVCLPLFLSALFFDSGSLVEPGAYYVDWTG